MKLRYIMPCPKSKPTYEFIRYDIRPPSGLTDVESDYLVKCVDRLQSHKLVKGIRFAFELPGSQRIKRSTGKHCHLGIWFGKPIRTDKVPINLKQFHWPKHAIKVTTSERFTVGEYWKAGYIEKDGQSIGNLRPMLKFWLEHERALKSTIIRCPDMTCGSFINDVVNWWYQNHVLIKAKHSEILSKKNALGVTETPVLDIRHVYANYIITLHPNVRLGARKARRLWLAQTTWSDYREIVRLITDVVMREIEAFEPYQLPDLKLVDQPYHAMDKVYPIDGEY